MLSSAVWNERATASEFAVLARYVRRSGPLAWARPSWPDGAGPWHYWWHAHLIDACGDAVRHRPSPGRRLRPGALARVVALRTAGRWVNPFYDDIAWMGLALSRALPGSRGIRPIARRLIGAIDPTAGALPWHVESNLFNAPANGPAAILLARVGERRAAERLSGWIAATLDDPHTGLVRDGIVGGAVRRELYTYNQGVAIGAALVLGDAQRAAALVEAVDRWCEGDGGLLPSPGGGDGGLFAGILCRYLAEAATHLPPEFAGASETARRLVLANAEALWRGQRVIGGRPFFSADPRRPAVPATDAPQPDGDLSVQLSAWMTLEAAVAVTR